MNTKAPINNIIAFKDFRVNSAKYIKALEKGMSFTVVKKSKPIFRLEPMGVSWESLADFTDGGKTDGIPAKKLIKYMKAYGRKHYKISL